MKLLRGATSLSLLLLCALCVVGNAQQNRGVITGQVVTEDGTPMPGLNIRLFVFPITPGGISPQIAVSDADGKFQFTNLRPRTYTVAASETGAYVSPSSPISVPATLYRPGEHVTLRLIRGGVITGRATYANGNPLIGVHVMAIRTRDAEGRPLESPGIMRSRMTDDRGIYRIYGLLPGTYVVAVNYGSSTFSGTQLPTDGDAPTFHPSSTRDTAAEVQVSAGAEISGTDIRHRGERGHIISGKVTAGSQSTGPTTYLPGISLLSHPSGAFVGNATTRLGEGENSFSFVGVPDGEYELVAAMGSPDGEGNSVSEGRRVTVRGADVTGIELRLLPLASIAGRLTLEPAATTCEPAAKNRIEEVLLLPRREEQNTNAPSSQRSFLSFAAVNEKGEFKATGLAAGRYRLTLNLPTENWFVKSIDGAASNPTGGPTGAQSKPAANDLGRSGALLKSGEKVSGVTVTLAEGAAGLRGKAGAKSSARRRVHLVPAEAAAGDDVLRYAETQVANDGAFAFANLAPGKYRLLVRAIPDDEPAEYAAPAAAWNAAERARLRKDAEAANHEIELKPCRRVKDHLLQK